MVHRIYHLTGLVGVFIVTSLLPTMASATLQLTERDYFKRPGLDVLVYSNWYNGMFGDSKISGVELIQQGIRSATNGDVRLNVTPEQWDAVPAFINRTVDHKRHKITARLHYPAFKFNYSVEVQAADDGVDIAVVLDKPLPKQLQGKAGFNLEFLPASYFGKAFIMDQQTGTFPLYPTGIKERNGVALPSLLSQGHQLTLAPGDNRHRIQIQSKGVKLNLFDGRAKAQNGWFVVRSLIPINKTGRVIQWHLDGAHTPNWIRNPVIGHSQVGYHPNQQKVAVIELDANDTRQANVHLYRIDADGKHHDVLHGQPTQWGQYTRYHYVRFDFSQITQPGLYQLRYLDTTTAPFRIADDVYNNAWHPTLDTYMPVQMDHMLVSEAYRVWHGASHLDDALQAPVDHQHFDLYAQGPTTDTPYKPGEHIPGLNIGGWYDAGDYDIRTQTQYNTVISLVDSWLAFKPMRDTTLVDYPSRRVEMHVADGKPDILQQIEHGTLQLVAQHKAVGHAISGIIVGHLSQYTHLGDGITMTDNLIYNKKLGPLDVKDRYSGKFDDRWAFTSKSSALNYGSAAGLAAASRALSGYNNTLAKESLQLAIRAWDEEQHHKPNLFHVGNTTGGPLAAEKLKATSELLLATKDKKYANALSGMTTEINQHFPRNIKYLIQVMPLMDSSYKTRIRSLAEHYVNQLAKDTSSNPYGVQITEGGWAGNGTIIANAINCYWLHQAFPDLIGREQILKGLDYLYGTHPHSDISFVSNVGTQSKKVAYGNNRADFSFISGGIVPGVLILKPDYPENKENWPFMWGENEYVVNLGASYIFLVNAAKQLLNSPR